MVPSSLPPPPPHLVSTLGDKARQKGVYGSVWSGDGRGKWGVRPCWGEVKLSVVFLRGHRLCSRLVKKWAGRSPEWGFEPGTVPIAWSLNI
jgi:hypothetical protein